MPKENLPVPPPNTEPHPMREGEDPAEDLEDAPLDETEEEEAGGGLGPRG